MPSQTEQLSEILAEISEIDREVKFLEDQIKAASSKRRSLAARASTIMQKQKLDGVKASGRSWRVVMEHRVNAPGAVSDEVMEAAEKAGIRELLSTHSTTALKSWLKENAENRGVPSGESWLTGTPFEGVVSEYIEPVLRHRSN